MLARDKFKKYIHDAERILFTQILLGDSVMLDVEAHITDCRDHKDNKFLDLADTGKVDYLVTGDDDLLVLHPFKETQIIKPRGFLEAAFVKKDGGGE